MFYRAAVFILLLGATPWVPPAAAEHAPMKINFQGKLLDPATNNPKNGTVNFTFRICAHPSSACTVCPGAVCLWEESQSAVPVTNGVFSVQLGGVTGLNDELFASASAYLSITASPDASEMTPRQQLSMSPYAFAAMRLTQDGPVSVRSGIAYSTFTTGGNLQLPAGVTATTGTFSAAGNGTFSLSTSSGVRVQGGTLKVEGPGGVHADYGVLASTGRFTGTGASVFSVEASSGISVAAGHLQVTGHASVSGVTQMGLNYQTFVANNAIVRVACANAADNAIAGGCNTAGAVNVRRSYPSTENTDSSGTAGTAVADAATAAASWTCVWSNAAATNAAFVICARMGN